MNRPNFNTILPRIEEVVKMDDKNTALKAVCEILKEEVYHYDWVGFYELVDGGLVLGPYVGKPTDHTHIAMGKGVCGQVAESCKTKVVQDVSQEGNYIACSIDVQSEIVVPIVKQGNFVSQIDIDSHSPAPFTKEDEAFLKKVCELLEKYY